MLLLPPPGSQDPTLLLLLAGSCLAFCGSLGCDRGPHCLSPLNECVVERPLSVLFWVLLYLIAFLFLKEAWGTVL